jgi:hypothetical protein
MDSGIHLRLKGVLYVHIYISLLRIYENIHLKPTDRKPRVEGVDKRRMSRFLTCYNEVEFYINDFSFKGQS